MCLIEVLKLRSCDGVSALLILNVGTVVHATLPSSESVSTYGPWEDGKTYVDFDLWLLRKNVCYSLLTSYLPDSPNDSRTYFSLGETSSVEVPLCIGGNPAFPSSIPPAVLLPLCFSNLSSVLLTATFY